MSPAQATLALGVVSATPLLYAALGELLCEKVGLFNAGIEGVMLVGAVTGFIVAVHTENVFVSLLAAAAAGAGFTAIVYGIPALLLGAQQVLVSFAVWFVGAGLASQVGLSYSTATITANLGNIHIPLLDRLPFIGKVFFDQFWPFYVGVILALIIAFILNHSQHGLNMRAIGEDPASAHASGVQVRRWQAFYLAVGGGFMGVGGAILSVAVTQTWTDDMTAGRGFIAFGLVIFAGWRSLGVLAASYVFGVLLILADVGQTYSWPIPAAVLSLIPYVMTVVVLIARTLLEVKRGRWTGAPAALGISFRRGQL